MSSKSLKEYGLEYIEEMSKDRSLAQQEVSVIIAGAKKTQLGSDRKNFELEQIEKFSKYVQDQVSHILDAELNRITIKSLGRIRQIITKETQFIPSENENTITLDDIKNLQKQLEVMKDELAKTVIEKNDEIRSLQSELTNIKAETKSQEQSISSKRDEIKKLNNDITKLKEENDLIKRLYNQTATQLTNYEELIKRIKEESELKDQDFIVALEDMYKTNQEVSSNLLEESINQATEAIKREHELENEQLNNKIILEQTKSQETIDNYDKEIKMLKEELEIAKNQTETIRRDESPFSTKLILNYTQKLLSTHPFYAAMLILINLGGTMPMSSLAKSVGANPMRLKEFLIELQQKGLVRITDDVSPVVEIINV
ncbi:MAG: hypothetical protein ACFFD1_15690 [Candidatus Thorarchaeota archaeon]